MNRGFSIVELLTSVVIGAIVVTIALYGFNLYISTEVGMRKRVADVEDLSLIKLKLGLGVGGGNLRLMFFTGMSAAPIGGTCTGCTPTGNDSVYGRFMIPFPNRCRDLTSTCEGAVALLTAMPNLNRPSPYALCLIGGNQILTRDNIVAGPLVALVSPPSGSMFFVTGPPQVFGGMASLPDDCRTGIERQNNGVIPPGTYYTIPVKPAIGNLVTGGTCVCDEYAASAVVEFPVRVINVDVYSTGLAHDDGAGTSSNSMNWGMVNCGTSAVGTNIQVDCKRTADFVMRKVKYVEVDQMFRVVNLAEPQMWYSLNPNPDPRLCRTGECKAMTVPSANMRVRLAGEGLTNLDFKQFSLVKQDVLRKMRFKVLQEDDKVQTAEIQF